MAGTLQHRIVSWVSANLFDHVTYTVRNGLNQGLRRKGGLGWLPTEHDTPELRFWKALDLRGKVVYDVGAFQGILTIFYARNARAVVAWEPNSRNRRRLMENVKLNQFSNVIVRPYGLSSKAAQAEMRFDPLMSGMATVDSGVASGSEHETIELRTLDGEQGLEPPDLIKIDVEGAELNVLRGMRQTISRLPGLLIIIEYCPKNLQGSGVAPRAVYDELKAGGLTIQFIREDGSTRDINRFEDLEPVLNPHGYTNLLCSRSKS